MQEQNSKPINVSLRVIADLSQGLYRSPADALKELVSNAYDADSSIVEINFGKDFSSLTIKDFGKGMTVDEFIETMETIGGSSKRSGGSPEFTLSGRKIVGRIGIGLLSVSQIASQLEIESTTQGKTTGFRAQIEFDQFASEEARKIKITDLWEGRKLIQIGNYFYSEIKGVDKEASFTTLKLTKLKRTIVDKLIVKKEKDGHQRMIGTKFKDVQELVKWMYKKEITKTGLHEYDRLFWELCTLCPVPYSEKAIVVRDGIQNSSKTSEFNEFAEYVNRETHLNLLFDGIQCIKPILMPLAEEKKYSLFFNLLFMKGLDNETVTYLDFNQEGKLIEKKILVRGYIYFQRPRIWPPELEGVILRVRHVAVGQYDSTFLTYRRHEGFKFSQMTGEILVDDLDAALNIDRSSFRETEPAFVALREAIHSYLSKIVFPGIKSYANEERNKRQEEEIKEERTILQKRFKELDTKKRKVVFSKDQAKMLVRSSDQLSFAISQKGKNFEFGAQYYRILTFLEMYLSRKLSSSERDDLYSALTNWLREFE